MYIKLLLIAALTSACGEQNFAFLERFIYNVGKERAYVEVEFNRDLSLNQDIIIPIDGYGSISLLGEGRHGGFTIQTQIDRSLWQDQDFFAIETTRLLPNGAPFSSYVNRDLSRIRWENDDQIATSLYLGPDSGDLYLGAAIELSFVDAEFPSGLVIRQRVHDQDKRLLGIISVFGPQLDEAEELVAPGGMLFITKVNDLLWYQEQDQEKGGPENNAEDGPRLMPAEDPEVNQEKYRSQKEQRRLLKLFLKKGKESGVLK